MEAVTTNPQVELQPQVTPQPSPEPKPEVKPEPKPEVKPEPKVESKSEPDGSSQLKGQEPEAKPEPKEEPKPVEYTDFEVPEGLGFNETVLAEFKKEAAADGLSQERAQKYVSLGLEIAKAEADRAGKALKEEQERWREKYEADPDKDANLKRAVRALNNLVPEEYRKVFTDTWLGDHPAVRALLVAADKATSEGSLMEGGHVDPQGKTVGNVLWGDSMKGMGSTRTR